MLKNNCLISYIAQLNVMVAFSFRRPETSFLWFTSPFKTLKYIIWRNYKWYFIIGLIVLLLIVFIVLLIYAIPVSIFIELFILTLHVCLCNKNSNSYIPTSLNCIRLRMLYTVFKKIAKDSMIIYYR